MDVSENSGTPKSSILIGFSIIFTYFHHPFWDTPIFGNTQITKTNVHDLFFFQVPHRCRFCGVYLSSAASHQVTGSWNRWRAESLLRYLM